MKSRLLLIAGLWVIGAVALAQQGGSGRPGGATNSTQYRVNTTTFGGAGPGAAGQVLTSNGAGSPPTFEDAAGGNPGGADTQVQYNDNGAFGGDAGLTFNETTNALTATGPVSGSVVLVGNGTAGAPSLSFTNDPNTGLLTNGSGVITISNDGSSNITISNASGLQSGTGVPIEALGPMRANGASFIADPGGGTDELTVTSGAVALVGTVTINGAAPAVSSTGTFTITWDDACTTSPTTTVNYTAVGNMVVWRLSPLSGGQCTSDSTDFEATSTSTVPAALIPAAEQELFVPRATDNGITTPACIVIPTNGTVRVEKHDTAGGVLCSSATSWTAANAKSLAPATSTAIVYNLQ